MGFWSGLKNIALKAAPIAAAFIPGVGPLASMAISGAANAASKKLSGGSWKDAAISGGIGAATGGALKGGLGPSGSVLNKITGKGIGSVLAPGGKTGAIINSAKDIVGGIAQAKGTSQPSNTRTAPAPSGNTRTAPTTGLGPSMNAFGNALTGGSRGAVKDQGFRKGYDVNVLNPDTEDEEGNTVQGTTTTLRMPKITSSYAGYQRKQNQPNRAQGRGQNSASY